MTRSQFLLPLISLLILGTVLGLRFISSVRQSPDHALASRQSEARLSVPIKASSGHSVDAPTFAPVPTSEAIREPRALGGQKTDGRPEPPPLPESIAGATTLTASSWENPFAPELWQSSGWQFSSQGMQTIGTGGSSAVFARPYQKLMMECDIRAGGLGGGSWELRLATPDSSSVMRFIVRDDRITVQTSEHDLQHVVLQKPLTNRLSRDVPRQFRIVATGNRIVVSWDGRRLLTTEQVASQSGRDVFWSIHTKGAAFQILRLRVEGD